MDQLEEEYQRFARDLEVRYELPSRSLDEYKEAIFTETFLRHNKFRYVMYMRRVMPYINYLINPSIYDQFTIARLDALANRLIDSRNVDSLDDSLQYVVNRYYNKIAESKLFVDYMDVLLGKLEDDYHRYARMRSPISLDNIDRYLSKHPEYDWTFDFTPLFEYPMDPAILHLIFTLEGLIQDLKTIPDQSGIGSLTSDMEKMNIR